MDAPGVCPAPADVCCEVKQLEAARPCVAEGPVEPLPPADGAEESAPASAKPFLRRNAGRGASGAQVRSKPNPNGNLIKFLRGTGVDCQGRSLHEILDWDFATWERLHDYIQWVFPSDEVSRHNLGAPVLTKKMMHTIRGDLALQAAIRNSLHKFCDFLGLELARTDAGFEIRRAAHFEERRQECWLGGCGGKGSNHNWLRISRALRSLRVCGLEEEADALMAGLGKLLEAGVPIQKGMPFWRKSARPVELDDEAAGEPGTAGEFVAVAH